MLIRVNLFVSPLACRKLCHKLRITSCEFSCLGSFIWVGTWKTLGKRFPVVQTADNDYSSLCLNIALRHYRFFSWCRLLSFFEYKVLFGMAFCIEHLQCASSFFIHSWLMSQNVNIASVKIGSPIASYAIQCYLPVVVWKFSFVLRQRIQRRSTFLRNSILFNSN